MLTTTRDPISMNDVTDLEHAPFVVEGTGDSALKIYFESEETRRQYLDIAGAESINDSYRSKITRTRNSRNPSEHTGMATRLLQPLDVAHLREAAEDPRPDHEGPRPQGLADLSFPP